MVFSFVPETSIAFRCKALPIVISMSAIFGAQAAGAQDNIIEEVVVWGRSIQLLGTADSASQGVV